jgi:glycosyltransferase involved in cell wall biosynthesis
MARGLCVAASDVGAVSYVVNESNGWLIQAGSVPSLTKTMRKAIEMSKADLERLQSNARSKVASEFNWDSAGKQLILQLELAENDYRQRVVGKMP